MSKIRFIGAGGSSMSGLMELSAYLGFETSGSDARYSNTIKELREKGFDVIVGSDPEKAKEADLVVFSGAIPENDLELSSARKKVERGEFLGIISRYFSQLVAIAGAHGKTTITAMISHVLNKIKGNYCAHFGGESCEPIEKYKGRELLVTEACEYRNSFLSLFPDYAVISNVEYDHPDFFPTFDKTLESFAIFASQVKKVLVVGKNVNVCACEHATTLKEERDFSVKYLDGKMRAFVLSTDDGDHSFYLPNEILEHNLTNAAYAAVLLQKMGISVETTAEALISFRGVKRRMEYLGKYKGGDVYLDYAHHPTQISDVIKSVKKKYEKVVAVFQPHTYSRTKAFLGDFVSSLELADVVFIMDVYAAREKYDEAGSSAVLFEKLSNKEKFLENDLKTLSSIDTKDSAILFLGAGNIDDIARTIIKIG